MLAFLLSGYRQRLPRLWRAMRWLLVLSQVLLLLWQPMLWLSGESPSSLTIVLLVADGYALWWLLTSRRLGALVQAFSLARRTRRVIIENLLWAGLYNGRPGDWRAVLHRHWSWPGPWPTPLPR